MAVDACAGTLCGYRERSFGVYKCGNNSVLFHEEKDAGSRGGEHRE